MAMIKTVWKLRRKLPEPVREALRRARAAVLSVGLPRAERHQQPPNEVEASEKFSIVVAISDAPEMTERCLASLERYAPKSEVIVVDDGSRLRQTLDSMERFQTRNGWRIVHHESARGHSKSCEAGAGLATRPYLCLLNSDTVVTPWSWWATTDAFEAGQSIGITGPSTSYAATAQMVRRAMHCRHYWSDTQICSFAQRYMSGLPPRSWLDLPEVGGFAFFIRGSLWKELGGFDPSLPDFGNESELCKRASAAGWRIVWTQNSYIHHFGHQSYGRLGEKFISSRSREAREYIQRKFDA